MHLGVTLCAKAQRDSTNLLVLFHQLICILIDFLLRDGFSFELCPASRLLYLLLFMLNMCLSCCALLCFTICRGGLLSLLSSC